MSKMENLKKEDRWLAAEYALGVLGSKDKSRAQRLVDKNLLFRREVESWQNQLEPLLDEVDEVEPPKAVWSGIEREIMPLKEETRSEGFGIGFWKMLTAITSTAAVASFGAFMFVTGGDITGKELNSAKQQLASAQESLAEAEDGLSDSRAELASLKDQLLTASSSEADVKQELATRIGELETARSELESAKEDLVLAQAEVAEIRQTISQAKPLVASLTQSGDAPAFIAQYDPLKQALLIRTTVSDADDRVPEIWLIPEQGDRKGEVLSLGVMDEAAPDVVKISDDFIPLLGEGGTLAISMEPPGGAPNGVATGPIVAVGKFQGL